MSRSVDIVIVNWNSGEQLSKCIASIERFGADIVSKVVVVDNGSTDGSADELGSPGFSLTVLKNETNNGFGRACNEGAAVCDAEYLLFLNPDTELFARSLAAPLKVLDETKNDGVGICGVQLVDESGEACVSYWRFPKMSDFIFKQLGLEALFDGRKMDYGLLQGRTDALRVDQVIGAFFIIRMSVYAELGGFDERFFVYYEEVDLSLRAYQAGWRSACATSATCLHIGGGCSSQVKAARLFYSLRSRIFYAYKHFSRWSAATVFATTYTIEFLSRSVAAIARRSGSDFKHVAKGYSMLWGSTPEIFEQIRKGRRG